MKMHPSITPERIMGAVERQHSSFDDPGFCIACGLDVMGVEPDASEYECESCGEHKVYGAEELLFHVQP